MSNRRTYTKPGAPRYTATPSMAAAMFAPPARNPAPAPDTGWRGTLDLLPDGDLLGELQDLHGWTLTIVGTVQDRDTMALRSWVRTPGLVLVAFDDHSVRSDLTERLDASWPWSMTRTGERGWTGAVVGLSWRLCVTGTRVAAGRLGLSGVGERVCAPDDHQTTKG